MCSVVLKTRLTESEELSRTKARQYHTTNQNCDVTLMRTTATNIPPSHPPKNDHSPPKKHLPKTRCRSKRLVYNCYAHISTRRRSCAVAGLHCYRQYQGESRCGFSFTVALFTSSNPSPHTLLLLVTS